MPKQRPPFERARLYEDVSNFTAVIREGKVITTQAFYRPFVLGWARDIGPLVGQTGVKSLWLA